ncbi:DUF6651 domain-containing protein [Xylophilus sp.]|uniref:DUF6651 domain-containing protein n=1 Tax=Xylophilus sp. TaxID=2653893 RepID=UPI0013B961C8|nr:DUF6651 domain-containing protein [Xylophilus sp.]KAF1045613.1 MAG: hypothetical protein GAK38_02905 [Xylophilus sp.]
MKLKLDEAGNVIVQDGKPVYIADDGKEVAFDVVATVDTIKRLNGEAKGHREGKEAAERALKAFEGIDDPAAAIKALNTVANLDAKKLVDAGEIDKVKTEISKVFETKLADAEKRTGELEGQLYAEKIGGSFSRSKVIADKFAIPADLVQARFGNAYKIEDGKVVAYDSQGNKIYSRARPGELADFDEALETLVEAYPYKDQILKGTGASGSGAGNNGGSGSGQRQQGDLGGSKSERTAAVASRFPELK